MLSLEASNEILQQAVAEKASLQLSAIVDGQQRALVGRVLRLYDGEGADHDGVWVDLPGEQPEIIAQLARDKPVCIATTCIDHTRYTFQTEVIQREKHFWLDENMMLDALLFQAPVDLRICQDRASHRLPVSDHSGVSAKLFRLAPKATLTAGEPRAAGNHETVSISGKLVDLSPESGGFLCAFDAVLASAKQGQMLACVLQFREMKISLVATLARVVRLSSRSMRIGFRFYIPPGADAQRKRDQVQSIIRELERQQSLRQRLKRGA
jgi:hypothetical protein